MRNLVLILSVMTFSVSCSYLPKKAQPEASQSAVQSHQELSDTDLELKEIEEIASMPTTGQNDLNEAANDVSEIPVEINQLVKKWIHYYQGRGREVFEIHLSRSARYIPMMKAVLKERGLPEDLVYIALIESGFSPKALSRAGAVGYWQFMRGTGRDYGLKINSHIDERRDPVLSTLAAADYFSGLYNLFGSWYLAIASYNTGENRIKRMVMTHHTRDFWELIRKGRLPSETVNYVPKFIAASLIAKNPAKFGFHNIPYQKPFEYEEVNVVGTVSLSRFAQNLNVNYLELRALNPIFKTDYAMPARGGEFVLRVPKGKKEGALLALQKSQVRNSKVVMAAARSDNNQIQRHKVRPGEGLIQIANRYGVTLTQLAKANKLSSRSHLRVGQNLIIPGNSVSALAKSELKSQPQPRAVAAAKSKVHVVRRGETLASIARRYRVPMARIASANDIKARSRILVGDRIEIPD